MKHLFNVPRNATLEWNKLLHACTARNLNYFGYQLVMLTTLAVYDLVAANTDERAAAEVVLHRVTDCDIFADKGFLGDEWQTEVHQRTGNRVWTPKRANQARQNPPEFDRLLGSVREHIEGTFHCLQNTGRTIERLLAKTIQGLSTRVILKVCAPCFDIGRRPNL
ncbi:MAG: transposase [Aggregatilineales bacterium]